MLPAWRGQLPTGVPTAKDRSRWPRAYRRHPNLNGNQPGYLPLLNAVTGW